MLKLFKWIIVKVLGYQGIRHRIRNKQLLENLDRIGE